MHAPLALFLAGLGAPSLAHAGELGLGVYAGHLATPNASDLPSASTFGGRLRYRIGDYWAVEGSVGGFDHGLDPRLELQRFVAGAPEGNVRMFLSGGYGVQLFDQTGHDLWDVGLGTNAAFCDYADFRADLRYRFIRTYGSESWQKRVEGGFFATVGIELHSANVHPLPPPPPPPPDSDGDGLLDSVDACPTVPEDLDGFADNDGCPDPDNDGDGVLDTADQCPTDLEDHDGFADEDGCPDLDNDQDGIADTDDRCPQDPETRNGYQDKDGCPDEIPAEVQKFSGKIEGIKFETGKAVIQPSSYKVLDSAAAVLVKFPEIRLEVQGHTDDVGDDAKNLDLSQRRAQAVVDYLVKKGVTVDRLVSKGYGETKPMVPNDNAADRAINRRVEFQILK